MKKTAWNDKGVLDPKFLGSWDVPESGKLIVKIKNAETKEVDNFKTNKKESKLIINLFGYKPMVCNITNAKAISLALKTKYLEDWANKYIEIGTKKIRAFGETTLALRVKDIAPPPPPLPNLNPDCERWSGAVKSVAENEISIEKIKGSFELSEEHEEQMKEEAMSYVEEKQNYQNEQ